MWCVTAGINRGSREGETGAAGVAGAVVAGFGFSSVGRDDLGGAGFGFSGQRCRMGAVHHHPAADRQHRRHGKDVISVVFSTVGRLFVLFDLANDRLRADRQLHTWWPAADSPSPFIIPLIHYYWYLIVLLIDYYYQLLTHLLPVFNYVIDCLLSIINYGHI